MIYKLPKTRSTVSRHGNMPPKLYNELCDSFFVNNPYTLYTNKIDYKRSSLRNILES